MGGEMVASIQPKPTMYERRKTLRNKFQRTNKEKMMLMFYGASA